MFTTFPWVTFFTGSRHAAIICAIAMAVFIHGPGAAFASALDDATAQCRVKLGPGATAREDLSFGETSYVCNCTPPYVWNEDGTACKLKQGQTENVPEIPEIPQIPPDDSPDEAPDAASPPAVTDDASPAREPVVRKPAKGKARTTARKKPGRVRASFFGSPAKARRYCRRRYGSRLVKVRAKKTKFWCYYYGRKAKGANKRVKWKKFKFRDL